MILSLERKWLSKWESIGELYLDGVFFCYTLEDRIRARGCKVPGLTAIWEGVYELVIDWSNRFKRRLPHILNVPDFDGIRIHPGNKSKDTLGCILVGMRRGTRQIYESALAFDALFGRLESAVYHRKESLEIRIYNNGDPQVMRELLAVPPAA